MDSEIERLPLGIPGFDKLVEGGLPKGGIYVVSGQEGCGKSIFGIQAAMNVAKKGKPALYISMDEHVSEVYKTAAKLGWDLDSMKNLDVRYFNIRAGSDGKMEKIKDAKKYKDAIMKEKFMGKGKSFDPYGDLLKIIQSKPYAITVIDPISDLSVLPIFVQKKPLLGWVSENVIPVPFSEKILSLMQIATLFEILRKTNQTILVTSQLLADSKSQTGDVVSGFKCDGIIRLHSVEGEDAFRTMNIPKMRRTNQKMGIYSFEIVDNKGISIKTTEQ